MVIGVDVLSGECPWLGGQRVGFWPSRDDLELETPGLDANLLLSDQD